MGSVARDIQADTPPAIETNLTDAARSGTSITANSTIHTKATSYTTLIASTVSIAYGVWVIANDVATSATATGQLMDLATGAAASESIIVPDINIGYAIGSTGQTGKIFYFPGLSIPAGTRISARSQALISSDTANIVVMLESRAQWHVANSAWIAYGVDASNSRGTSVTPGNGAFGSWTSIGTTSRNHNLFTIGVDGLGSTNMAANILVGEIGYGPNSSTVTTMGTFNWHDSAAEVVTATAPSYIAFALASGNPLWCRISSGATQARGVIIYGN
jgi:hypothetical protein